MEALRDSVPAVPPETARSVIRSEFGREPEEIFASFDDEPVASASIAQVHRATLAETYRPVVGDALPAGAAIAVKVVRPGIDRAIASDIASARAIVAGVERWGALHRYSLPDLLEEFAESINSECDLRNEARAADRFAFDLAGDPLVVVPRVVWPLTTRRVLTMEYVEGWKLDQLDEAARSGIDGRALAEHGAEVFMRGVLIDGRYHADLHPANILVTPEGRICYLDFGIVGTTEPAQREAIAQVLAATVYGDAERALTYSAQLGLVIPKEAVAAVTGDVAMLMAETLAVPPRDIRRFAVGFLRVMNRAGVSVPAGFGLLVKALVTVEGVARALYPGIDITETAKPFATRLIAERMMSAERLHARAPEALKAALRELSR